jgi:L-fuculose-phosphate aldolase
MKGYCPRSVPAAALVVLLASGLVGRTVPMSAQGAPAKADAPGKVDVEELKAKVAQATRMLFNANLLESSGHVSIRVPGTDHVLIGERDVSRAVLQASDIITVDINSKKIDGKGTMPRETEIHTGIYRARPDVFAVAHTHPLHSSVFSITMKPILPVSVHGAIFAAGVPVYPQVGHVDNREKGDALARTLGDKQAALLKMHGAVIVGSNVERAFAYALHLEENAEKQLWAEASGTVTPMTPEDVKTCLAAAFGDASIQKIWEHHEGLEKKGLKGSW